MKRRSDWIQDTCETPDGCLKQENTYRSTGGDKGEHCELGVFGGESFEDDTTNDTLVGHVVTHLGVKGCSPLLKLRWTRK